MNLKKKLLTTAAVSGMAIASVGIAPAVAGAQSVPSSGQVSAESLNGFQIGSTTRQEVINQWGPGEGYGGGLYYRPSSGGTILVSFSENEVSGFLLQRTNGFTANGIDGSGILTGPGYIFVNPGLGR